MSVEEVEVSTVDTLDTESPGEKQADEKDQSGIDKEKSEASEPIASEPTERKKKDNKPPPEATRPDYEEFENQMYYFNESIDEFKVQLDEISEKIDSKKAEQKNIQDIRNGHREAANAARLKRSSFLDEEDMFRDQLEAIEKTREAQREYLDSMKEGLKFTKVEDLDTATAKIINKLSSGTVSIDTQSKLARSLQELRGQRERVVNYAEQLQNIKNGATGVSNFREMQQQRNQGARSARLEEDVARKAAKEASNKERGLSSEIDVCFKTKRSLTIQKKKVLDQRYSLQREHNKADRAWERWSEYQKYLKRKQAREERAARRAEEDAKWQAEQNGGIVVLEDEEVEDADKPKEPKKPPNPHKKQIDVLEELITYITNLLPKQESKKEEESLESKVNVGDRNNAFKGKGVQALSKDEEENPYFNAKKKEKRKKKKKVKDPSKISINHIHDVFEKFHKVQIATPLVQSELDKTLAALTAKKAEFEAWKPESADAEPPKHVLENEEKHRSGNRRASVAALDAEQMRRIQEAEDHANAAREESVAHRRKSVQMATTLAEEERARRIAEHEAHEQAHLEHREAAIVHATEAAQEEQRRRVAEHEAHEDAHLEHRQAAVADVTQLAEEERKRRLEAHSHEHHDEAEDRKNNRRRASEMLDEEKARRIAEHLAHDTAAHEDRKIAQALAHEMVETEREARMETCEHAQNHKKSKGSKKKKKSKKKKSAEITESKSEQTHAPKSEETGDSISLQIGAAEKARAAAGGCFTESTTTRVS